MGQCFVFPQELTLSSIVRDAVGLSLIWHLGKEGWRNRAKSKDCVKNIGLDRYRFDAYRQRIDRSVVRFEWRFADKHCAIFIHRNKDIDHDQAMAIVWEAVQGIGLCEQPCARLSLSEAVKSASRQKGTKQARLEVDGGFVELCVVHSRTAVSTRWRPFGTHAMPWTTPSSHALREFSQSNTMGTARRPCPSKSSEAKADYGSGRDASGKSSMQ